jgi:hypothetical protein
MKKFIDESWNEYLALLKTVVPQNIQDKFNTNKTRYIKILIAVILIEIILFTSYNIFVPDAKENNKVDINQTKPSYKE